MAEISPTLSTTRGASGPRSTAGSTLPPALLELVPRRLGVVSLVYAITYGVAFFPSDLIVLFGGDVPVPSALERIAATTAIFSSLAVYAATRSARFRPAALPDLGLLFLVLSSLGIAFTEVWQITVEFHVLAMEAGVKPWFGISWVCVWIVSFAILVPGTPGKVLLASLAAASTPILVLLVSVAAGASVGIPPFFWLGMALALYSSALIAFVGSRTVYGLGKDLSEAREMGSYRLVEKLGQGGMGEVWRAEHRLLARPAAIKFIRPEALRGRGGEVDVLRRFEREAKATALLRSPHTVELYDFGVDDDGRFYYVMELLEGLDLESIPQRFGALSAGRVVALLRQVCDSLSEAHDRGLVHRDIKPANIYVCRMGNTFDFVKVLDFGLVKHFDQDEEATRLTGVGVAAGTPAYMAPEMAEGIAEVDHRADLYALGCVGYWLLTGVRVFEADSPVKMIVEHARTSPQPPSARVELPIPAELDEIVLWCLEKDPAKRPASAAELSERLLSVARADPWEQGNAREWWNLHLSGMG